MPRVYASKPFDERFWEKVDRNGPPHPELGQCWLWTAAKLKSGYGVFAVDATHRAKHLCRKTDYAHRVAYELLVGPIPEGMELDHLCRIRACVNPAHLEAVTHRENTLRGVSIAAKHATVTHCPQGHPYAGDNLYIRNGARMCRTCRKQAGKAWYEEMRRKAQAYDSLTGNGSVTSAQ